MQRKIKKVIFVWSSKTDVQISSYLKAVLLLIPLYLSQSIKHTYHLKGKTEARLCYSFAKNWKPNLNSLSQV